MVIKNTYHFVKKYIPISWKEFLKRRLAFIIPRWRNYSALDNYSKWKKRTRLSSQNIQEKVEQIKNFKYRPKISFIMPVYNTEKEWLNLAIKAVRNQIYDNWELCIVNDGSTERYIKPLLDSWSNCDTRIKVYHSAINNKIAKSSNQAISMSTGVFIFILDHDDEIEKSTLFEIIKLLNKNPNADLIYFDEDKPLEDKKDKVVDFFFKPDWSPDLLRSNMYIPHCVLRKKIVDNIGGFREKFPIIAHDYDLVIRFSEKVPSQNIFHIPKVLYHWRDHPKSISNSSKIVSKTNEAALQVLNDYLNRNNIAGSVELGQMDNYWRIKYEIQGDPLVTIIIPIKNHVQYLKKCLKSIYNNTNYRNFEIIIVNNASDDPDTLEYINFVQKKDKIRVIEYPHPFNYSAINNYAAQEARGEFLLFLNVDTEIISRDWLRSMLEHAQRKDVGAVGAKLVYPNNTIQHAGIVLGWKKNGVAGHAFAGEAINSVSYKGFANCIRNVSAVTAACMMVRKDVFNGIGGFDENNLKIIYNDVDLCLRLCKSGFNIVYTPYAVLRHYETAIRDEESNDQPQEKQYMIDKWGEEIAHDPYYNPNFSLGQFYTLPLNPEHIVGAESKIFLSSDLYIRNSIIAELIQELRLKKEVFSIIDIGGYDGKLDLFLNANDHYKVLDTFRIESFNYIKGDVRNLELADDSCDIVISSEVLEHINSVDRERAVNEMVRVAKKYLIIGAPFKKKTTVDAEKQFNNFFKSITGQEHPWLKEHIENGLPDVKKFEAQLRRLNLRFTRVASGNINNWFLLQCMILYGEAHYVTSYKNAIKFYNSHYAEIGDFQEPVNRYIYIIPKQEEDIQEKLKDLLIKYQDIKVDPKKYFKFISMFFDALNENYKNKVGNVMLLKKIVKRILRR